MKQPRAPGGKQPRTEAGRLQAFVRLGGMMETRKWETQTLSVVVKPEGDPVYSELATTIEITDEAAGPFIEVRQAGKDLGKVRFDVDEWEVVKAAIDHMVGICKSIVA